MNNLIERLKEIDKRIAELNNDLANVKGKECSVWSRIVGYCRPVEAYNAGQKEQYFNRKTYKIKELK